MNLQTRAFQAKPATREHVPLLIGLMGPSGSGKTYSALRLATGIQAVVGGKVYGVDTEARRMLHYADHFKFEHVQFDPPFGSLDYLAAIRFCVEQGAAVVVVDSMSHEHSGVGGMIEFQEQELERLAGNDWGKRERVKMLAWQKPKAARRKLIDGLLQLNANFVFCFRAKETVKPVKVAGKTEIVPQGFMPIAGDEFLFEQTVNCLLLPQSGGVPTWKTENAGERMMIKPAKQFDSIFAESTPLSEDIGRQLAEWARGGTVKATTPKVSDAGAPSIDWQTYVERWFVMIDEAQSAEQLRELWNGDAHKQMRREIVWPAKGSVSPDPLENLQARVTAKITELKISQAKQPTGAML